MPNLQSELVADLLKDEYNFEFLRGSNFKERELEDHLINNITKFLLELGKGFAFIGKQYHIEVGGQDFLKEIYITIIKIFVKISSFKIFRILKYNFVYCAGRNNFIKTK